MLIYIFLDFKIACKFHTLKEWIVSTKVNVWYVGSIFLKSFYKLKWIIYCEFWFLVARKQSNDPHAEWQARRINKIPSVLQ